MQAPKFFNTAGPVNPQKHYALDPLSRVNLAEIETLIAQEKYFILHAPRQTGKTSVLLALANYLNQQGNYLCVYANLEVGQAAREDISEAMQAICQEIAWRAKNMVQAEYPAQNWVNHWQQAGAAALSGLLTNWAVNSPKPIILLLDEIDSLVGDTLIAVLRQIRAGYDKRPAAFPSTIILCGVRDIRDYRLHTDEGKAVITGGSAFNIKAASLRLGNFSRPEVETLYQQHTQETGQIFTPEAIELAWHLTQGQPWLVNALAYEVIYKTTEGRNPQNPITAALLLQAKEQIISRRETHLDGLIDKLKEERVRRVIEPMILGSQLEKAVAQDDIEYVLDLGLVNRTQAGIQISNPIYREVIPRELTYITQINLEAREGRQGYILPNGRLNMSKLMTNFQQFFRENSEHWLDGVAYLEAAPHLLLQAFLQRIINGGGRVEREYGLGRGRTDLLIIWPYGEGQVQREVLELKIFRSSLNKTIEEGLAQTWEYMDKCGADEGHFVLFDQRQKISWAKKIFKRTKIYQGKTIFIWGM
jgi:hypothetical protein